MRIPKDPHNPDFVQELLNSIRPLRLCDLAHP
jgi:hypothetical protein